MLLLVCTGGAEQLRISPDDLRLRVAVSEQLPPSIRRAVKDLAKSEPLPVEDGLIQTESLFEDRLSEDDWNSETALLVRYYFLVARLEASQEFSDEFLRRQTLLRQGVELLNDYIETLNPLVARAGYTSQEPFELETIQTLPLNSVKLTDEGELLLLHRFPKPLLRQGRRALRSLRQDAQDEKDVFKQRLKELRDAESDFLREVSTIGKELIRMRPEVRKWVTEPGEGLPFSP